MRIGDLLRVDGVLRAQCQRCGRIVVTSGPALRRLGEGVPVRELQRRFRCSSAPHGQACRGPMLVSISLTDEQHEWLIREMTGKHHLSPP